MVLRAAVVGAGAAGLAAARRLQENGLDYTVYEQNSTIGGTWVFDSEVGSNEYGVPIHTSMYKNLRTNLPKEVMGYPDYPILNPTDKSYIKAEDILTFLNEFAQHFAILPSIKFNHQVTLIEPTKDKKWNVTVRDVTSATILTERFDAILVCNGHYNVPITPTIEGVETFTGCVIHSHDYRVPDKFQDKTIVVIGAGPSGLDIALDVSEVAKQVVLSHHLPDRIDTCFPDNFIFKPDVQKISKDIITFVDDTSIKSDFILYCTGYKYSLPFLSKSCGVEIHDNYVYPLYKHMISIRNPTLCLIGLPFYVCAFSMFDLQVRFFLKTLDGGFSLPSEEEMLKDEQKDMKQRRKDGFSLKESHKMGPLQGAYYEDLAQTAGIQRLSPVLTKLHNESSRRFLEDLINYRLDRYVLIDEENYLEI